MIYCIEDDKNIRDLVVYALQSAGLEAMGFPDGETFFHALAEKKPSLIILDIMLPGEDGLSILKQLKQQQNTKEIPVVMLTAMSGEYDKVQGLDFGADDYISKPFGVMELIARVKAVLRRTSTPTSEHEICIGKLRLNLERHKVFADGQDVALTYKEFELLHYLMKNQGLVLSRDKLLETVWGYEYEGETRTVDVHVRSLRLKLGNLSEMIETVRGIGYRIGGIQ